MAVHRKKFVNESMYKEVEERKDKLVVKKEKMKAKREAQDISEEESESSEEVTEYVGKPKYMFDKYKEIIKTKRINDKINRKRAAEIMSLKGRLTGADSKLLSTTSRFRSDMR